ncbi:MAG: hypothetical protein DWQ06_12365 [Calditrichaeota bacterium]|nr:MAG: hypothetical protein DWQ06_12365 [Calditrichota bacterium]
MKLLQLLIVSLIFVIGCGSNPVEEALKEINEGKPNKAIRILSKAENPTPEMKDVLARARLLQGKIVVEKTRKPEVGERAMEAAEKDLEGVTISAETKKVKEEFFMAMADAFNKLKVYDKAFEYYDELLSFAPNNAEAKKQLDDLSSSRGNYYLEKAQNAFDDKDDALKYEALKNFRLAEKYLPNAVDYDDFYQKIYKTTRNMFSFDDYSIRINDIKQDKELTGVLIDILNNTESEMNVNVDNFSLVLKDGKTIKYDAKSAEDGLKKFESKKLASFKSTGGVVFFQGGKDTIKPSDLEKITYTDGDIEIEKHFAF